MRIFRRGWTSTRRLMVLAAWVLVFSLAFLAPQGRLSAQTASSPPADQEWSVRDSQGFRSRSLSLGSLFQIRIDGRTLSPTWSSDRQSSSSSSSTTSSSSSSSQKSGSGSSSNKSTPERKVLDPKIEFEAEYQVKPVSVVRHMRLDPKRRAVRILDVFTNPESQDRSIRIDYQTYLSERGGTRFGGVLNQAGESREYGNGVPDDTVTALIFAERQDSTALPLFVWGQSGARWPVSVQDISSNASLSYEGTIPANGKVALLHWVAVAGQDKGVKIERTSDLFWKEGRLIDPMVPTDIAPLVVNFTPDSLKVSAPTADNTLAQASGRLVHLEELCGKLSVSRGAKDLLWMGKDEQFSGTLTGSAVEFRMSSSSGTIDRTLEKSAVDIAVIPKGGGNGKDDSAIEIPLADIAGIRGGGGRGREHRVYLRNGAVLIGRASLKDCRLAGELGELTLDADALELLLMRVTSVDGKVPDGAVAFAELRNGAMHWLGFLEGVNWGPDVQLVTVFGNLSLYSNEIWSLERRTEPPFNLVAVLADGCRIHGVARQPALFLQVLGVDGKVASTQVRTAELVRFGATELLARQMALPGSGSDSSASGKGTTDKARTEPPPRYCWLRDGSLLVGTIANPALSLRTGGNEVELKTEDILRMSFDAANGNVANIELRSGAKMQGELVSESVDWQLGTRRITLPVGWVQEVMRKDLPAPPAPAPGPADAGADKLPAKTTARNPGENDPLAVPDMKREFLKEVKIDFPPSSVAASTPISGTVSLPRLDRCDAESVKKRLTFLIPGGMTNVALNKPVTVSTPESVVGVISSITDGSAKDDGGEQVTLGGGLQWVQVDLGEAQRISKIMLWHYHRMPVVYEDVIVQVSDDPNFKKNVKTIFNNDHDDTAGFGKGPDIAYVETNYGWLIDGAGAGGRYVRFYSRGNSYSEKNDYLEIMIFGAPRDPTSAFPKIDPERMAKSPVTIVPTYPKPAFDHGKPISIDAAKFPHLEKFEPEKSEKDAGQDRFVVPRGTTLVSFRKPVTSSAKMEKPELLSRVTDGSKEFMDTVELPAGNQWVQIDLGGPYRIRKILVWHEFKEPVAYHDVMVMISDHPEFKHLQYGVFNNDHDNSSSRGQGRDHAYIESNRGRLIDANGVTGRYVRLYSNGNSKDDLNRYCEVMVWGEKIEQDPPDTKAANPPPDPAKAPTTLPGGAPMVQYLNPTTPNDPTAVPRGKKPAELTEQKPAYPPALYKDGWDYSAQKIPNLEKLTPELINERKTFFVPNDASIVSKGKLYGTSSMGRPELGGIFALTDGVTDGSKGNYLEFLPGLQWVQVDLGSSQHIWKVLLWHFHRYSCVYYDVVVQVSDDFGFRKGVQVIFNNDHDNSSGLGKGADPSYIETNYGRLIDGCGAKGRYVRFYSNGSTASKFNHYVEVSIYGSPAAAGESGEAAPEASKPSTAPPAPAPTPAPAHSSSQSSLLP